MANFYSEWLATSDDIQERLRTSPRVARDEEVPWVETRQDARAKLLIARERGFPTMGGVLVKGEIPVGWHTGRHVHGEEAIHILRGEGFSVIGDKRYDWHTGTSLNVPYRAEHQHFNTGNTPAQYLSAMSHGLEEHIHLARLEQLEDHGPNSPDVLASLPTQEDQFGPAHPRGVRRIALHLEDAPRYVDWQHEMNTLLIAPANGFRAIDVAITHMFEDSPRHQSGLHAHLEAMIYVLAGRGYSEVQGDRGEWGPGDALHVPPNMSVHRHYNPFNETIKYLRIQFGIRYYYEELWPEGYALRDKMDVAGLMPETESG